MKFRVLSLLTLGISLCAADHSSGGSHAHSHDHGSSSSASSHPASLSVPVSSSYSAASSPSITSGYSSASVASSGSSSYNAPKVTYSAPAPSSSYNAPAPSPSYSSPVAAAASSSSSYSAPSSSSSSSSTYSAPSSAASSTSYSAPAPAPAPSYEAAPAVSTGNLYYYYYPVAAYPIHNRDGKPHPSHGTYPSTHGHSSTYVKDDSGGDSDFGPLIFLLVPLMILLLAVPFLALLGTNVNTGRSFDTRTGRSELDSKFGSFSELQSEIDHLLAKYVSALDSEQCMDRIVCELGVKASALPSKSLLFSVVEWLAPPNHALLGKQRIGLLRKAATDRSYNLNTCKKFICHPPAIVKDGITVEDLKFRRNKGERDQQQGGTQVF